MLWFNNIFFSLLTNLHYVCVFFIQFKLFKGRNDWARKLLPLHIQNAMHFS